jgi:hypothetical protein
LVDILAIAAGLPFFALAGAIIRLDGKPVKEHQENILNQCIKGVSTKVPSVRCLLIYSGEGCYIIPSGFLRYCGQSNGEIRVVEGRARSNSRILRTIDGKPNRWRHNNHATQIITLQHCRSWSDIAVVVIATGWTICSSNTINYLDRHRRERYRELSQFSPTGLRWMACV